MIVELSIIGICVLILLTILFTLIYLGYFKHVEVKAGNSPIEFANKKFAFKSFKDNYSGIGYQFTVLHNLTAVQEPELRNKLSEAIAVGIYFDNPDKVKNECKFTVGLLLTGSSDCEEAIELLKKENYEISTFPNCDNVIHTSFPFKGSVSIPIAIRSVYPKLNEFIKSKNLFAFPSMEFYSRDQIHFILPLEKHKEFVFYVNPDAEDSTDEESDVENTESDKSPNVHLKNRSKELRRSSSGSSFDELTLENESDKNV